MPDQVFLKFGGYYTSLCYEQWLIVSSIFKLRLGASRTRSVGWLVGRSVGWLVGRSVGWLVCLSVLLGY